MVTTRVHTTTPGHTTRAIPECGPFSSQANLWKSGLERKDPARAELAAEEWLRDFRGAAHVPTMRRAA